MIGMWGSSISGEGTIKSEIRNFNTSQNKKKMLKQFFNSVGNTLRNSYDKTHFPINIYIISLPDDHRSDLSSTSQSA